MLIVKKARAVFHDPDHIHLTPLPCIPETGDTVNCQKANACNCGIIHAIKRWCI